MSVLPEEVLHAIVQHVAYNYNIIERELLNPSRKYRAAAILPLSVASRQFRRICLQFLFAHVEVGRVGSLKGLQRQCLGNRTFSACIRTLELVHPSALEVDRDLLPQLLSCLCNLSATPPRLWLSAGLISGLGHSDLEKFTLQSVSIGHAWQLDSRQERIDRIQELLDCGLQVEKVVIVVDRDPLLNDLLVNGRFAGLLELELISFTNFHRKYFRKGAAVLFIDPFIKAVAREGLNSAIHVQRFAVTRDTSKSSPEALHWRVTGLYLSIVDSLEQILYLASSLFPQISVLTIRYADELTTSLCRFSSLSIVSLLETSPNIDFGSDEPWQNPSIFEVYDGTLAGPVATEFTMIRCASRLAKLMPSIQAFYILDLRPDGPGERDEGWSIQGWIFVHDMQSNSPIRLDIAPPHMRPAWRTQSSLTALKYKFQTFFV
ncbi:hypothetical protein F5878DRAFT_689323 [Lentinula raphanica]|uniref:Uncharacterized protein n=1 Tax=Lentinula raphanica TaxID=153919 RepID=A0AA38P4V9_9AGAR|nr:hypothetical protein F5878DRAFT_689323 [Lentinula raphanica]